MKKIILTFMIITMICLTCVSCKKEEKKEVKPHITQMKSICELATMECYYHNVAKYEKEDVEGILLWKKDKKFWMEYSGTVTVGIDASKLSIEVKDGMVRITIPEAEVLANEVNEEEFNEDSMVVEDGSAKVKAEDQTAALKKAQKNMVKEAKSDKVLLANARERAKTLLEEYVNNIGTAVGKNYTIEWIEYKE